MTIRPLWIKIIIVILVVDVVLIAIGLGVRKFLAKPSSAEAAQERLRDLEKSIDMYYADCKSFPTMEQGLEALRAAPDQEPRCSKWDGPYADVDLFTDPWGNRFIYGRDGDFFTLKTFGQDGQPGGEGLSADVALEDL
ncbi:MAG: type II secretion system protein GspG [Bdellovibrionaceae bacterium]|nr:type II secretion system protein GspG [Pseudobdellovibrionaceae bacterium]